MNSQYYFRARYLTMKFTFGVIIYLDNLVLDQVMDKKLKVKNFLRLFQKFAVLIS